MMKLTKVKIYGFKSQNRNVEVKLSNESTSIIYGDNGCGKTTFLKILNAVFTRDEAILLSEEVTKIEISYLERMNDEVTITINKKEDHPIPQQFEDNLFERLAREQFNQKSLFNETGYDWGAYRESALSNCKSLFLGVDRGTQSQRLNVSAKVLMNFLSQNFRMRQMFDRPRELHEFCTELASYLRNRNRYSNSELRTIDFDSDHVFLKEISMENVQGTLLNRYRQARRNAARQVQTALFDTLAVAISEEKAKEEDKVELSSLTELIFKNRELIIEALDDNLENSFKDTIVDKLKNIKKQEQIEALQQNPLLMKLLVKMSKQLQDSEDELSAINTVIDRFNRFTGDAKKLDFVKNQLIVKVKNGEHSINELSSGERHILTLLTLLLDQGRKRDFIIIDEPEISLNSKWQEALLPTLTELLPYSQIIVASHSPIIVQSIDSLAALEVLN